ncbi:MAG: sporulation integral membrane protein YtvI [Firmicutes bacterium]|nr:sporulation integral membrane protein YtvI [Bacillota bacterium]MBO2520039.1 sporulation integral membrane protein YtvI [Bacillota bacterium]
MAVRSVWILVLALGAWYLFGNRLVLAVAPFLLAALASPFLHPLAGWIRRGLRLPRSLAVLASLLLVLLLLGGLLVGATLLLAAQVSDGLAALPQHLDSLRRHGEALIERITEWYGLLPPEALDFARENVQTLVGALEGALLAAGQAVLGMLTAVPVFLGVLVVALIATYFVTRDWEQVKGAVVQLIPPQKRELVRGMPARLWTDALRYVRAQVILILISTFISLVGLLLLGIDQWLILGLVGGLLDVMPLVGPGLLYVPWALYLLLTDRVGLGLGLLAVYGGVSAIRQLVEPRVVGGSMGIHPLLTLGTLYVATTLFGLPGLLLAPIIIILGKAAWESGLIPWFREAAAGRDERPEGSAPS